MNKIYVFSGAGLSADSGVPTFRDKNGLWQKYDLDKVCNFDNWIENYNEVHEFYGGRRGELASVEPNQMHIVLAELQQTYGSDRIELWTQNIDDLLERAGAADVKHVHGFLTELSCPQCQEVWDVGYVVDIKHVCPKCDNQTIKPNVVFFGQPVLMYNNLFSTFYEARKDPNAVILVIGTSGNVVPMERIVGFREESNKAFKVLCNKEKVDMDLSIFDMCFIDSAVNASCDVKRLLTDILNGNQINLR